MVGQQFVRMLEDHPYFDLVFISSSDRSAGKKYEDHVNWAIGGEMPEYVSGRVLKRTTVEDVKEEEVDLVFSGLPSNAAAKIEKELAEEGITVFSNARPNRMEEKVPILIPEINEEHIQLIDHQGFDDAFIMTNSNCSASGLTMGLAPLLKFGVSSIDVVTYQALSGAGLTGVPSLSILGNVIPLIKGEEDAMEAETKKVLGTLDDDEYLISPLQAPVRASCARVPVINGHLENVTVQLVEDVDTDELKASWDDYRGPPQELELPSAPVKPVRFMEQEDRPQPAFDVYAGEPERAAGMTVSVGRLREKGPGLMNFWLLVHNTIRGASGASVLNAEYAFKKGLL